MSLSIIGPGFGRTGTMSCKNAVEQLGFGPCYHMSEVYERGQMDLWADAINGAPLASETIFAGYRAAFDWPACSWWKALKAANPNAKIVLTRRDPDAWYDSISTTIFKALPSVSADPARNAWRVHTRKLIFDQTFHNDLGRDNVISVLRAHEADVIASVPADELLVFDVGDGWEPLCAFLGVAVPETPFPRTNTTAEFRQETGLDAPD